jgi:uracil-DNA glycosylase
MSIYENDFGDWYPILQPLIDSEFFIRTLYKIDEEYATNGNKNKLVLPVISEIFKAFRVTNPDNFKVLILGQDPYPEKNNATGIAFGIRENSARIPPSLQNLIHEIELSQGSLAIDFDYTLRSWCDQGVLLLNSSLTVVEGKPDSHSALWYPVMTLMLDYIVAKFPYHPLIVFGKKAESVLSNYTKQYSQVLTSPHPAAAAYGKSPGAIGSGVFKNANYILTNPDYRINKEAIIWDAVFLNINNIDNDEPPY